MRERFETQEDLENESRVIIKACEKWNCTYEKLPIKYSLDYALLRDEKIVAFCEVRCRKKIYDTYMLSLYKFKSAHELKSVTGIPSILLVEYPDKTMFCALTNIMILEFKWGGMTVLRDWQDQEPMVFIPMKEFKEL